MTSVDVDDAWEAREAKQNALWEEFIQTYSEDDIRDELDKWNEDLPEGEEYTYEEMEQMMFDEYCENRD